MVRLLVSALAAPLLLAATASAQYVIEATSFGQKTPISPDGRLIPGWHLSGENHIPQLLSDRIILTPPAPGAARGAAWAETTVVHPEWSAEVEFRASGQERGSGNLQIWFVKGGKDAVGQSSVYTIGKFDGFVLVIDQYAGRAGSIRGFLNDGSASFRDHHNVDSLAFGNCEYAYRNLGRPSKLRIENGHNGLKVEIDDRTCFASDKVNLPPGNYFGVSAATAENPDSFELNKFVVSTTNSITREEPVKRPSLERLDRFPESPSALPDTDASTISNQAEQFADLHNRLQGMTHQIANIFGEFDKLSQLLNEKHNQIVGSIPPSSGDAISALSRRLENIERTVQTIQRDVEGRDYKEHLNNLQQAVEGVRGGLTDNLPDSISQMITTSAPKMGKFIFVVIAFQVILLGAYIVYKKRRDNAPKKYL
ncbi:putative lectin family integral membrane protein [Delphinella strobiligena]|nr:putative lectin family integral membrane protein [Delphinella strobiligena]